MNGSGRISALLLLALATAARANDVPTVFPEFDESRAVSALVVARVAAGAQLPEFPACLRPNVICMHSPFWFKAQILSTISGHVDETSLNVFTESHDDMQSFVREPMRLLVLKSHGGQVLMPLYESRKLHARRDGELFLIEYGHPLPPWLPCMAGDLREPIVGTDFGPEVAAEPDDDTGTFEGTDVAAHPETWRIEGQRAYPRNGIRVTRLRDMIQGLVARNEPTDCARKR